LSSLTSYLAFFKVIILCTREIGEGEKVIEDGRKKKKDGESEVKKKEWGRSNIIQIKERERETAGRDDWWVFSGFTSFLYGRIVFLNATRSLN